ncbi:hypothetical protein EIP86_002011 [Pleurotus ostreatoroseus]|nr:hypothetical protein EIP86_002011 [Pleurotus ostreatoroseus]
MTEVSSTVPAVLGALALSSTPTRSSSANGRLHVRASTQGAKISNPDVRHICSRVLSSSPIITSWQVPLEVHLEKMRLAEALAARDHAVRCMETICSSLRKKEDTIGRLQQDKADLEAKLTAYRPTDATNEPDARMEEMKRLEVVNRELKAELDALKLARERSMAGKENESPRPQVPEEELERTIDVLSPVCRQGVLAATENAEKPDNIAQARFSILAELPLPVDMPEDTLIPIIIPHPFTIHDFIGTAIGSLKSQLTNYRVFQETTTMWCPDREEHGYYLTPVYRCNTNPRVSTAHRWATVDLAARVGIPTGELFEYKDESVAADTTPECFYHKDGKWSGSSSLQRHVPFFHHTIPISSLFRTKTTQSIIKDTLSARKNTSPQNIYETGQLYACGALKAACIGLQCIGFDERLYRALLAQAEACAKSGRWRGASANGGLGTGTVWNVHVNVTADANVNGGFAALSPPALPPQMLHPQPSRAIVEVGYGTHA